jgi:hypothetical protein
MNQQFTALINSMSTDELREANNAIVEMLKAKRSVNNVSIKSQLYVGMPVYVDHPNHKGELFTIEKINRTRAVVQSQNIGRGLSVPFEMLIIDAGKVGLQAIGDAIRNSKPEPAKYPHLEAYIEEFVNRQRSMFRQTLMEMPTDAESAKEIISIIQSHASPENLTCDGELSRTEVNRRARMIRRTINDLERLTGTKIETDLD